MCILIFPFFQLANHIFLPFRTIRISLNSQFQCFSHSFLVFRWHFSYIPKLNKWLNVLFSLDILFIFWFVSGNVLSPVVKWLNWFIFASPRCVKAKDDSFFFVVGESGLCLAHPSTHHRHDRNNRDPGWAKQRRQISCHPDRFNSEGNSKNTLTRYHLLFCRE